MNGTSSKVNTLQLILIPSIITLAITLVRLVGELQHWNKTFFNPEAGGGGAVIGISWLPFILGPYFAFKLMSAGERPTSTAKPIVYGLIAILVAMVSFPLIKVLKLEAQVPGSLIVILVCAIVAIFVASRGWAMLNKVLLAYAYAARIPVAIIMLFAIKGGWGTHYDVAPPNFPAMSWFMKWFWIGALPQLILWI